MKEVDHTKKITNGPRNCATKSAASKKRADEVDDVERLSRSRLADGSEGTGHADTRATSERGTSTISTNTSGEWLRGSGPESDIVISSRIRLARNLAEFPFISRASRADRAEIERHAPRPGAADSGTSGELEYVNVNELEGIDRQFLVERQLISREHAESQGARGVAIDRARASQPDDQRRRPSAHPGACTAGWICKAPGSRSTGSTT